MNERTINIKLDPINYRLFLSASPTIPPYKEQQNNQQIIWFNDTFSTITKISLDAGMWLMPLRQNCWRNVVQIQLEHSMIGDRGCKYLSNLEMRLIKSLNLQESHISGRGAFHLCKANWMCLSKYSLRGNDLRDTDVQWVGKTNWPIFILDLQGNQLKNGLIKMLIFQYQKLNQLHLISTQASYSNIGKLMAARYAKVQVYF